MPMPFTARLLLCAAVLSALSPLSALACTLWGAAGEDAGGGTLISKNRDWQPDHQQLIKLVRPKSGFAYVGLIAEGNGDPGLKAGVNEKGLTIVSASSNVPDKLREAQTEMRGVMRTIMANYASVDAVLLDAQALFGQANPNYYLISDRSKVLTVEVGLGGKFTTKLTERGVTSHTNHYTDPALAEFTSFKTAASSGARLARIDALLESAPRPLSAAQFARMSRDQVAGPNNSLWRTGTGKNTQTLASWIVQTPADGAPRLHLVIANPGAAEYTKELLLDAAFWQRAAGPLD